MKLIQRLAAVLIFSAVFVLGAHAQGMRGGMGGNGMGSFRGYDDHEMDHNLVLPQIAVGEHYTTSVVLLNLADPDRMGWNTSQQFITTGKIYFYKQDGKPLSVSVNGKASASEYRFSLDRSQMLYLNLIASGSDTSGWGLIQIDDPTGNDSDWGMMDGQEVQRGERLMATVFYAFKSGDQTLSRVGVVPSMYEMERFFTSVLPVQNDNDLNTGVAIVNANKQSVTVELRLKDSKGQTLATKTLTLAAGNQTAKFVNELFGSSMPAKLQGTLEVVTQDEGIVTLGLLMSGNIITSIPTHHYGQWKSMTGR